MYSIVTKKTNYEQRIESRVKNFTWFDKKAYKNEFY